VKWRHAVLYYSSLLLSRDQQIITRTSLRRFGPFDDSLRQLELSLPNLAVTASFSTSQPAIEKKLFAGVHWTCLQPKSDVTITANGSHLSGLGYVERLDLTIPPWKLPLTELHWGRFLSAHDSVIWIDWRGAHQITVLIQNGHEVIPENINASEVCFTPASTLNLDRRQTLRTGRLGNTVAASAPILNRFFPERLLNIRETKWSSLGSLTAPDHASTGWAIHEVVEWPS
jgi:hypothetical protein